MEDELRWPVMYAKSEEQEAKMKSKESRDEFDLAFPSLSERQMLVGDKRMLTQFGGWSCDCNLSSLPSQNKHLHEQIKTFESIAFWHLLHETGNHRRLVLPLLPNHKWEDEELAVSLFEYKWGIDGAGEYDIIFVAIQLGEMRWYKYYFYKHY